MRFFHAVHHFKQRRIEVLASHTAEHRVHHTGRLMHVESERRHALNHILNLLFGRALLHYNQHG